jgi:hypothetical protein
VHCVPGPGGVLACQVNTLASALAGRIVGAGRGRIMPHITEDRHEIAVMDSTVRDP